MAGVAMFDSESGSDEAALWAADRAPGRGRFSLHVARAWQSRRRAGTAICAAALLVAVGAAALLSSRRAAAPAPGGPLRGIPEASTDLASAGGAPAAAYDYSAADPAWPTVQPGGQGSLAGAGRQPDAYAQQPAAYAPQTAAYPPAYPGGAAGSTGYAGAGAATTYPAAGGVYGDIYPSGPVPSSTAAPAASAGIAGDPWAGSPPPPPGGAGDLNGLSAPGLGLEAASLNTPYAGAAQQPAYPSTAAGALAPASPASALPAVTTRTYTTETTTKATTTTTTPAACGLVTEHSQFPGNDLGAVRNVSTAEWCCYFCGANPNCIGWTWGSRRGTIHTNVCYLKGGHPRGQLTRVRNEMFTSGQPLQVGRSIPVIVRQPGQSLFCISLMIPNSYEQELLKMQYKSGLSIFGCDEYAIYSNMTIQVAFEVVSVTIDSNLHCEKGGEFKTALNNDIFLALWKRLVDDGRFKFHDWTVKVDPDSVFFPARLRAVLMNHKEGPGGTYLNNCKYGMHGPLEILSRTAVEVWGKGTGRCMDHFNKVCKGPCYWGEDMFMDQCLEKVLKVGRHYDGLLLLEDHCKHPDNWRECTEPSVVAFHPFKTAPSYEKCVASATSAS